MNKNNSVPSVPVVVPVIKYENSDLLKFTILSDNKGKSGIYSWINKINQKRYVGSSEVLDRRIRQYFNINHLIRNSNLQICRALSKHGYSNFSIEILEYCKPAKCLKREQHYINLLKPEYNILRKAGSPFGNKHREDSKAKISAAQKGISKSEETRAKISASNLGKTRSEETRAKMSASKMGNSNGKNHPNSLKIEVTDLEKDTSTIYNSMCEAAKALNILQSSISRYFKNNQKKPVKGRYVFTKHS